MNGYVSARGLVNANDQQYINVGTDQALAGAVSVKGQDTAEFMKRDDVLKRVRANMQPWHEIRVEGRDTIQKCVHPVLCLRLRAMFSSLFPSLRFKAIPEADWHSSATITGRVN